MVECILHIGRHGNCEVTDNGGAPQWKAFVSITCMSIPMLYFYGCTHVPNPQFTNGERGVNECKHKRG